MKSLPGPFSQATQKRLMNQVVVSGRERPLGCRSQDVTLSRGTLGPAHDGWWPAAEGKPGRPLLGPGARAEGRRPGNTTRTARRPWERQD